MMRRLYVGWQHAVLGAAVLEICLALRLGEDADGAQVVESRSVAHSLYGVGDSLIQGAEYMTVLSGPRPPPHRSVHSLAEGAGVSAAASGSYAAVSPSLLEALRTYHREDRNLNLRYETEDRNLRYEQNAVDESPEAIPKTVLTSLDSTEYVGSIGIGTIHEPRGCSSLLQGASCQAREQQTLRVVFDTGSTNLWMASTLCRTGSCTATGRQRYDPYGSETYSIPANPRNLTIKFATATLVGPMGIDQFHIGPFTVRDQSFGLIQEEQGSTFRELPLEGIVGLAFPSMSAGNVTAFFDNVIAQRLLKKNMFSFYLSPLAEQVPSFLEGKGDSRYAQYRVGMDAILWGGVDKRLYEGELRWFPVTQAHYWAIDLHGFYVGDTPMNFTEPDNEDTMRWSSLGELASDWNAPPKTAPAKLIFDSGTAYYTAEDYLYQNLMDRMSCDYRGSPDVTYRLKDVDGNYHNLVLTQEDYMVAKCEPGFVKIPVPEKYGPAMLLGELFMRRYFTVFDRGDGSDGDARIGIARSRPGADVRQAASLS
eukprot:TRINITY_DN111499_c0_g1_i1.p1 TRINITY_DN111499_c0_g1~~TRINITY_DN111499_c0_g1_i1.p1  ORF type:complete len:537 (-),score=96.67 TRINITY_DN111499_c0_g1_i1:45-1655(-)